MCVPWIVFSSFLLTEVAAYPAFLWAVLALQNATVSPRVRNDVLALLGIALATLARTQFFVLVCSCSPPAIVLQEAIAFPDRARPGRGAEPAAAPAGARSAGTALLAVVYAVLTVTVVVLSAAGRLSATVGTYAQAVEGNPVPGALHPVARRALRDDRARDGGAAVRRRRGVARLAGLVGDRTEPRSAHAFAAVGTLTVSVLAIEVTSFDLRFGGGVVRERYFFYVVPLLLVAFAGALCDGRWPRWSLLLPLPMLLYGFWHSALPQYPKLNVDTPISTLHDKLLQRRPLAAPGARTCSSSATIALTAVFVEASIIVRRRSVVAGLLAVIARLSRCPLETRYAFQRLFAVNGTAGRPLTQDQGGVFDWVDRIARHEGRA